MGRPVVTERNLLKTVKTTHKNTAIRIRSGVPNDGFLINRPFALRGHVTSFL